MEMHPKFHLENVITFRHQYVIPARQSTGYSGNKEYAKVHMWIKNKQTTKLYDNIAYVRKTGFFVTESFSWRSQVFF